MPDPTTSFIVDLFILLASAVIAGEIAVHLGQVAMIGQLLVGILLGPTLLGPFIGFPSLASATPSPLSSELGGLQFLAIIFILFMAGLEVTPERIYRMGAEGFSLGVSIFLIPLLAGTVLVGLLLPGEGMSVSTRALVGVTLSMTALPVMGIMLTEFKLQGSKIGQSLMNAALVNEFLAVAIFSVILRLGTDPTGNLVSIAVAILSVMVFLGAVISAHNLLKILHTEHIWEKTTQRFAGFWRSKQGAFALLMVMLIGSTVFSQFLGLTYVMGAFFAGVLVTKESAGADAHESISYIFEAMTWGFFVPLFFVFVGVQMDLHYLATLYLVAVFAILTFSMSITKILTGAGIATLFGWRKADAWAMGYLVNSRGGVQLALALILFQTGHIDVTLFTLVAGVGIVTTMLAPMGALSSWLSDTRTREDLFKRVPSLRPRSPSLTQLRPPIEWGGIYEPGFSARANALRDWLEKPINQRGTGSSTALLPPLPGKKNHDANPPEDTRPALPIPKRKPPV